MGWGWGWVWARVWRCGCVCVGEGGGPCVGWGVCVCRGGGGVEQVSGYEVSFGTKTEYHANAPRQCRCAVF